MSVKECSCCIEGINELGTVQDNNEFGIEEALGVDKNWTSDEACEHKEDETDVVCRAEL